MMSPSDGELLWGRLRVGTQLSPGQVRLSGPGIVIGWDVKNADAQSGGSTTRINEPIKEFEAEFELTDEEDELNISDFDRWDEFEKLLLTSSTKAKPTALPVYHPDLARVGITAVTLKSIGLMQLDGRGGAKIKVQFIEYRPAKKLVIAPQKKTAGDKLIDGALAEIEVEKKRWEDLTR